MNYKNPSIVSGISISDILSMDNATFDSLGEKPLRMIVGRLVSAGNKRLRNFEKKQETSPAERYVMEHGGMFSTKGKNLNALRAEFKRAKDFLESRLMLCDLFVLSQEAVKLKPAFPDAYLNLGNVYKVSCHA